MSGHPMKPLRHSEGRDPLRSAGGLHEAGRVRRGLAEFLKVPLLITAAFVAAGIAVSVLDAFVAERSPFRDVAAGVVPSKGAVDFVSAVATSLLTVTSITFSVLLLAVQQTASSLTPVVFDQFLRRTANQVYFGFFVGVTAFAFLVLGLARDSPAPVFGAALTLLFTIAALVVLLFLIHSSIDQMRPQSVVRSIHQLALEARERELRILGRTRATRSSPEGAPERRVRARDTGYVVTVHEEPLGELARSVGPDAEILLDGRLGEYMVFGDVVARVVGLDPDDDSYDEKILATLGFDDIRDVDVESGYAIDQLENIAWATGTSAGQSPNTAVTAVRALRDLLGRWLIAGERDRADVATERDELPVVYADGAVHKMLGTLATLVLASSESRQAQLCAEVVHAFAGAAARLQTEADHRAFREALDSCLPAVIQHAELPDLRHALDRLVEALEDAGHDRTRVDDVRRLLTEATRRLLPKPSDEPEAAHPN